MTKRRIIIAGGGPAGMMAAIRAGQLGQTVILVEKNPDLGRKLLLSGKGRCNLTNVCDLESFLKRFSKNGQFLRNAFKLFFNLDLIDFFEKRGLKLKTERQLRVFPITDSSTTILEVLKKELSMNKVRIICKAQMKDVIVKDNKTEALAITDSGVIPADRIILATGGASYGFTGSTGEGLRIAEKLGHHIVSFRPGLVPLETKEKYPKSLEGLTLKNIRLSFTDGKKEIVSEVGELLFTATGISGPLVLSLSGQIADWLKENKKVFVEIDLKPALSDEQVDARLLREFRLNPKKGIKNILKDLLPVRFVDIFLGMAKLSPDKKAAHVTQAERRDMILLLKALRLEITGSRPLKEAMVTRGGVSLKDINPRTMESRIIKDLYFAGEMIDVDADTGGFNLQAAFSTGYLAGESAACL